MGKEDGKPRARSYDNRTKLVRVTREGGKEVSDRRSGIGEDERQPKMARLAAW